MELFKCEHLTKNLGEFKLNDMTFSLEPGMVLGVIGTNGCGKTTLLRSILGSYRLDQNPEDGGKLWIDQKSSLENVKEYRQNMAYVLTECPFPSLMFAKEAGEIYGYYYPGFDFQTYTQLLEDYEVPEKTTINSLSAGQKIRMQLAFAQSYPAKLYVFDEPVGNLDVEFRDTFYETIRKLVSSGESSVILSSHLVTELEHIADYLLWIEKKENVGSTKYFGTIDDLKNNYRILSVEENMAQAIPKEMIVGKRIRTNHSEFLIRLKSKDNMKNHSSDPTDLTQISSKDNDISKILPEELLSELRYPDLQEIMYFTEKENS